MLSLVTTCFHYVFEKFPTWFYWYCPIVDRNIVATWWQHRCRLWWQQWLSFADSVQAFLLSVYFRMFFFFFFLPFSCHCLHYFFLCFIIFFFFPSCHFHVFSILQMKLLLLSFYVFLFLYDLCVFTFSNCVLFSCAIINRHGETFTILLSAKLCMWNGAGDGWCRVTVVAWISFRFCLFLFGVRFVSSFLFFFFLQMIWH